MFCVGHQSVTGQGRCLLHWDSVCVNMKGAVLIYHWPDRRLGFKSKDFHYHLIISSLQQSLNHSKF